MSEPIDSKRFNAVYADLDKLFEHRGRLAISCLLSRYSKITFKRFKELLGETDGNLGAQLKKLEEAGYLAVTKEFIDRKPVSWYAITKNGQKALDKHLSALRHLSNEQ